MEEQPTKKELLRDLKSIREDIEREVQTGENHDSSGKPSVVQDTKIWGMENVYPKHERRL